jgi:hypothetical protein
MFIARSFNPNRNRKKVQPMFETEPTVYIKTNIGLDLLMGQTAYLKCTMDPEKKGSGNLHWTVVDAKSYVGMVFKGLLKLLIDSV